MIPWTFLAFTGFMGAAIYFHFYFAHSRWRRVRGQEVTDIDPSYVRREDYFGQSFRTKLQSWLELPSATSTDGTRTIQKNNERICVSRTLRLGADAESDDILAIEGDFSCGASSHLGREIHATGSITIGPGSKLQAVAADGDLTLGPRTEVARWADGWGELRLGPDCVVHSRATSRTSARLEVGAQARSIFAPEVSTAAATVSGAASEPLPMNRGSANPPQRLQIPPSPGADFAERAGFAALGFDPKKLTPLGAECWIYSGSLHPRTPVHVTSHLVVKGACSIPADSILEHDLKASGSLWIGAGSECKGNLISEKSLEVGPGVYFAGMIHADGEILLSRGVRGASAAGPVAVDAGSWLYVEQGVTVRGKLASGERVRVVAASFAQSWRHAQRPSESEK